MAAIEGPLFLEINTNEWQEVFCAILDRQFQAHEKLRLSAPSSRSNSGECILDVALLPEECECRPISMSLSALSRIMRSNTLPQTPYFFNLIITSTSITYHLAASSEKDRDDWMKTIRSLKRVQKRISSGWVRPSGFLSRAPDNIFSSSSDVRGKATNSSSSGSRYKPLSSQKKPEIMNDVESSHSETKSPNESQDIPTLPRSLSVKPLISKVDKDSVNTNDQRNSGSNQLEDKEEGIDIIDEDMNDDERICCGLLNSDFRFCGVKIGTIISVLNVSSAFPFIIVSSTINLQSSAAVLTSLGVIRFFNFLIYALPIFIVQFVLSQVHTAAAEILIVALYLIIYLAPVGYVSLYKVRHASSAHKVEVGTFCFRPSLNVRLSFDNISVIAGFVFEWLQHVLYVIPTGVVTSSQSVSKLSDFPPYIQFEYYFWAAVWATFTCGLILVLNSTLRGKLHYNFQKSELVWILYHNISSPMYVTVITVLFMGLSCDYSTDPPTLYQDPSIICYQSRHNLIAQAALMALSVYLIQHTLLPSGTFKETISRYLDIIYVPVYLYAHFLFKAIFCGVYVFLYTYNVPRVIILTIINLILLLLNNSMKPCSIESINTLRDLFFIHASISGIQSLNYLAWPSNYSTKGMVISTLASNVLFTTIGMLIYWKYNSRSIEYKIANSFLDLEWQVAKKAAVHPRVLEPLISLTLSTRTNDHDIVKKYIANLIFLIRHENMRVQFQSAWALANIALIDDDCRMKIYEEDGLTTLFECFEKMESIAKMESLAAITNMTLSLSVITDDMVSRHKCIPFFISLIISNRTSHGAQFAAIGLANLARKEEFREQIRICNGIAALVNCVMSRDYQTRRFGSLALANMALSPSLDVEQIFQSKNLLDRLLKMAKRKEVETQREVIALLRNLSCHARIRPALLDREIMDVVKSSRDSVYNDVVVWCEDIRRLMEREIKQGNHEMKILMKREERYKFRGEADLDLLDRMVPLFGQVEWSTWGSKLDSIFSPLFISIPSVKNGYIVMKMNQTMRISLSDGIPKASLRGLRDNMLFVVQDYPRHGKLSDKTTSLDYIYYIPNSNYVGNDSFSFILKIGSLTSWSSRIRIDIVADNGRNTLISDKDDIEDSNPSNLDKGNAKDLESRNSGTISRYFRASSGKYIPKHEVIDSYPTPREDDSNVKVNNNSHSNNISNGNNTLPSRETGTSQDFHDIYGSSSGNEMSVAMKNNPLGKSTPPQSQSRKYISRAPTNNISPGGPLPLSPPVPPNVLSPQSSPLNNSSSKSKKEAFMKALYDSNNNKNNNNNNKTSSNKTLRVDL